MKILVLPGDGIGPEVVEPAKNVLDACARRFGFQVAFTEAIIGGAAIDAFHTALPDGALHLAQASDAVLLGAVGGPKWDNPRAAVRPEQALLGSAQGARPVCQPAPGARGSRAARHGAAQGRHRA